MSWPSWLGTARARYLVGSVVVDGFVVGVVLALAYGATLPIRWPSDPLFPRYFVSYFASLFGWGLAAAVGVVSAVIQALYARWSLGFVNQQLPRWTRAGWVVVYGCVFSVSVVAMLMGDAGKAGFFLAGVSILVPGFWPSYLVVRRWEREHRQTLRPRGWSYRTVAARQAVGQHLP